VAIKITLKKSAPTRSRIIQRGLGKKVKGSAFRKCARLEIREPDRDPRHWVLGIARLDGLGAGEETAVDGIHDRLGGNLPAAKETSVKTLDGVLAALDTVELQVDIALGVGI
jgi:hypothetical protein